MLLSSQAQNLQMLLDEDQVRQGQITLEIFHTSEVLDHLIISDALKYMGFGNISI